MLIAQITDLHIRMPGQKAYRVVETDRYLPPAIKALNALAPAPDVVIISGDLTDFGRPAEYHYLRDMLAALRMPYYLMPGNHDAREQLRESFPEHGYLRQGGAFTQYTVEHLPLRLIMLDTVVPMQSHGMLCDERLAWLEARLLEAPDRPTVIAMHHPPFKTGIAHMDRIGLLQGADALETLVRRHANIERIICGHLHRSIFQRFGATLASTCPSPAHQVVLDLRPEGPAAFNLEPPAYHLHHWRDGRLLTHHAYIGEYPGPYPFHENGELIDD
ncbi:phosphodiesterase [Bordetella pseudohinzii]|uniref:Phosphodiesterase n=1 Tax=Bordetella pseudohinzii TaxID=1331258 RepID=A0A0J6CB52_9BORD|nr:phosphodiesterase [Bordetella pseudohinzii]ANY14487.1 phosphodiesterase [Bordetella pseudohinzii]KMM26667.1 metallophosphatase [Bordetella pseudohinzii]KXA76407.1 metallophosphatase [Bordetella pseudohinzii]KXA81022.1 metallophosphatase [Bordetella pseudohinzii]CUI64339.1 3'%2C5'-cyclic adenosine monophosphate phosphodiesterase CpdA [Bordetella pseudohinzii]